MEDLVHQRHSIKGGLKEAKNKRHAAVTVRQIVALIIASGRTPHLNVSMTSHSYQNGGWSIISIVSSKKERMSKR